jgi:MSHA type pilus biogenesis protein MshL
LPELPVSQIEEEVIKVAPRKLFSLSVRNADIREVLLAFGKKTDLNIVFGPETQGVVTVDLKRVTLEEALDSLLSPIGLVYKREGNFIRVTKPTLETRIFTLSYISTTRSGGATLSATAGGAAGGVAGATTTTGAGGGGTSGATSSVTSTDSVDLWGELEKTLATFLSKEGKAVVSRTAGLIAVTDFPANLRKVAQYLELVEGSAQRQVMIQAQILEVTLSKDFSAGINWSLVPKNLNVGPLGTVTGTLTDGSLVAQTLAPAASLFQIGLAGTVGGQAIQLLLNALSKQGKVAILSSPKISTLNNQKAVMKVAVDDVFFTVTREREPTTGVVTETVIPQTVTEGIVLDVTPQIGEDDTITMNVRPSISERVGQATSPRGDVVPIVAVRAADTVVRVKDSQTVVIGGLMQNRSTKNVSGLPLLQDIPVMGGLFRQKEDQDRKTELVILLTPTVLIGRRHSELTPQELQVLREAGRARPPR